ncbi:MAG: prepilin-type N-terminal cleavage/methylation domain-containing protein [Candidatus Gracilibacteria bacterium]
MKNYFSPKRAFTLIELLIVITIIGILAVALLPKLTGGTDRAKDAQRKADLQQIATALEFYADDNGEYPTDAGCVSTLDIATYLTTMPSDPDDAAAGGCTDGYGYVALGTGNGYLLFANLANVEDKGDGVYNYNFISTPLIDTASTRLSENSDKLCSTMADEGCTDTIYVVGR